MKMQYIILLYVLAVLARSSGKEERNAPPKGGRHLGRDGFGGRDVDLSTFKIVGVPYETRNGKQKDKRQQYCQETPIFGAIIVVESESDGSNPVAVRGRFYNCKDIDVDISNPSVNEDQAIISVIDPEDPTTIYSKNPVLHIYIKDEIQYLAWVIYVSGTSYSWFAIVDANSGDILIKIDIQEQTTTHDQGGNLKTGKIDYTFDLPSYPQLKNTKVIVSDVNGAPNAIQCASSADCSNDGINNGYGPASDAFVNGNVVVDLFDQWAWNLTPVSPSYMPLHLYVHCESSYHQYCPDNAYWSGGRLVFGNGVNAFYPLTTLDIVGHEAAHGFTEWQSGLLYAGDSGGMNEAYSDLAGEAAEEFHRGYCTWKLGEDATKDSWKSALRWMYDPPQDGSSVDKWSDSIPGGMDPHHSSGVYNKAYYLLFAYGWSTKDIFQVATKANEIYWTQDVTMKQGACDMIDASVDLFGDEAQDKIYDLRMAFKNVNIVCDDLNLVLEEEGLSASYGNALYYTYNNQDDRLIQFGITGGTGDADLYVKFGSQPSASVYDCRPYFGGNIETCGPYNPSQIGTYHIMVSAWSTFSGVTLAVEKPPIGIDTCQDSCPTDMDSWQRSTTTQWDGANWWRVNTDGTWTSSYNSAWRQITFDFEGAFAHHSHACNHDDFITVTGKAIGSWPNYSDRYRMTASFQNSYGTQVGYYDTGNIFLNAQAQEFSVTYDNRLGHATKVAITEFGDDAEYWLGHYGAIIWPPVVNTPISCAFSPLDDPDAWTISNGGNGWLIKRTDKIWISSYNQGTRQITVELDKYCSLQMQYLTVIGRACGSWPNYADLYRLVVDFKNSGGGVVYRYDSNTVSTSSYYREFIASYDNSNNQVTQITITEYGDDAEYWGGHYGVYLKLPIIRVSDRDDTPYDSTQSAKHVEIKTISDYDHDKPEEGLKPDVTPDNDPNGIYKHDEWDSLSNNKGVFTHSLYALTQINYLIYAMLLLMSLIGVGIVYALCCGIKIRRTNLKMKNDYSFVGGVTTDIDADDTEQV